MSRHAHRKVELTDDERFLFDTLLDASREVRQHIKDACMS